MTAALLMFVAFAYTGKFAHTCRFLLAKSFFTKNIDKIYQILYNVTRI